MRANTWIRTISSLLKLAEDHGYLLVSPLGWSPLGAFGTCLRLPAVFGQAEAAAQQRTTACVQNAQTLERSEQDVINVLEMVLNEYPVDRSAMFLTGHSMGSGGTWYLGAKYADYLEGDRSDVGPFRGAVYLSVGSHPQDADFHDRRAQAQHRRWREAGPCSSG